LRSFEVNSVSGGDAGAVLTLLTAGGKRTGLRALQVTCRSDYARRGARWVKVDFAPDRIRLRKLVSQRSTAFSLNAFIFAYFGTRREMGKKNGPAFEYKSEGGFQSVANHYPCTAPPGCRFSDVSMLQKLSGPVLERGSEWPYART